VSEEELQRLVQAETDRRESRRQQQTAVEHRRKLRDTDPYAFAEQERQAEQQAVAMQQSEQQFTSLLGNVSVQHDRVAIDPLVFALDDKERDRIMGLEGAGRGLDGRKLVVTEALKSLEKKWKQEGAREAEAKLRRNPVFRKQVFAEHRGSQVEPSLLPGSAPPESDGTVSDILRRSLGR
jgi:ATPase subunit of ABC transporter with duplicated ATPase domains